jgi:hypothetical protein
MGSQVKIGAIACTGFSRRLSKYAFARSDGIAKDADGWAAAPNRDGRIELQEAASSNLIESLRSIKKSFAMTIHAYCNASPPRRGHGPNPRPT